MRSVEWKTYRTRFLVKAKKLQYALSFTDHLGRQHCGRKGDYLVESSEGVLSIAPRQIFEDIYVPMPQRKKRTPDFARHEHLPVLHMGDLPFAAIHVAELKLKDLKVEDLEIEDLEVEDLKLKDPKLGHLNSETIDGQAFRYSMREPRRTQHEPPSRPRRRSPQPVRTSPPRLGLM